MPIQQRAARLEISTMVTDESEELRRVLYERVSLVRSTIASTTPRYVGLLHLGSHFSTYANRHPSIGI